MNVITFTRRFIAILLVLCNLPVGYVYAQSLNPPPPPDANCSTNPNGTVCHFALTRSGTNLPNWNDVACTGFTINFTFSVATHSVQRYDASGNVTRETRHVDFTGTLANSTNLSKTVPYAGLFVRTMDFQANTLTFNGLMAKVSLPGKLVAKNVGRVVLDLNLPEGKDVIFSSGHFDLFPGLPMNAQPLCAALS